MDGFNFYRFNGKLVMRAKRRKLTEEEKKAAAKTRHGKAGKGNTAGSKFGAALREINGFKDQADPFYHSRMTGYITRHLMTHTPENGGLGTRVLLPENVHGISAFTANSAFPKKMLYALQNTKFKKSEAGINVVIPELPVEALAARKADHYRVWVAMKCIGLKQMRAVWSDKIICAPFVFGEKAIQSIAFRPPKVKENEVLMAIVGVQSLVKGKMVADVRMNGFVFLAVDFNSET